MELDERFAFTCLRFGGYRIGLMINFNALRLKDGLRRFVM
jgi:hypothetical protein